MSAKPNARARVASEPRKRAGAVALVKSAPDATAGKSDTDSSFDRLVYERVRLGIMSALAVQEELTFSELKGLLGQRRQPERPCAQTRGGAVRHLHKVIRWPPPPERLPPDCRGARRTESLLGSCRGRNQGHTAALIFFCPYTLHYRVLYQCT